MVTKDSFYPTTHNLIVVKGIIPTVLPEILTNWIEINHQGEMSGHSGQTHGQGLSGNTLCGRSG